MTEIAIKSNKAQDDIIRRWDNPSDPWIEPWADLALNIAIAKRIRAIEKLSLDDHSRDQQIRSALKGATIMTADRHLAQAAKDMGFPFDLEGYPVRIVEFDFNLSRGFVLLWGNDVILCQPASRGFRDRG